MTLIAMLTLAACAGEPVPQVTPRSRPWPGDDAQLIDSSELDVDAVVDGMLAAIRSAG
ncbi:MAG: hypothetical protein HC927_08495 [Deltaproteobacteria bacterium]|nr:hypothetical protein [Deltaproteobacteria bacterium]